MRILHKKLLVIVGFVFISAADVMTMNRRTALLLVANNGDLAGTDLLNAAKDGNLAGVQSAITRGANINQESSQGDTPLMYAVNNRILRRYLSVIQELINHGANINVISQVYAESPLSCAANKADLSLFKTLMTAQNCDVNIYDELGLTPLLSVAMNEHQGSYESQEIIRILIEKGANPNLSVIRNNQDELYTVLSAVVDNENVDAVRLLCDCGGGGDLLNPLRIPLDTENVLREIARLDAIRDLEGSLTPAQQEIYSILHWYINPGLK